MARTATSKPVSPLAEYLQDVLYRRWCDDRQELVLKWERNDCTIRRYRQKDWKKDEGTDWRANNFIAVVKQKWLAGTGLVLDFILEGGQLGFGIKMSTLGRVPTEEEIDAHGEAIQDAERIIRTQFDIAAIDKETIKAVMSAGKYGMAWGHYYVDDYTMRTYEPVQQEFDTPDQANQRFEAVTKTVDTPFVEWVPVWEMFWDMTQDEIADMEGLCREQNVTAYQLREMAKRGEGWDEKEIERVIEEAAGTDSEGESDDDNVAPGRRFVQYSSRTIKYREFWTRVPVKILEEHQEKQTEEGFDHQMAITSDLEDYDGHEVDVLAVMANGVVVRYIELEGEDAKRRPFYRFLWEDDLDGIPGTSVADNGEQLQEVLNGAVNAFQDNKRLAGDVQGFYNPRLFPEDGDLEISPGKMRPTLEAAQNLEDAFQQLVIADVGESYLPVIALVREFLDEETHIPRIAQGATGSVQKTAFETEQLVEKSGKYMGGVVRNVDNGWTKPAANDFFRFNMADPDQTEGKGNFVATATGFSSFQAKVVRQNKLMQLLQLVLGSEELLSMNKLMKIMEELLRANDLDPDEFMYDEQETAERAQQAQEAQQPEQPQEDPEAAELDKQKTQAEIEKTKVDTQVALADQARQNEELKLKQLEAMKPAEKAETK